MIKPELVDKAIKSIKRSSDYDYFFNKIESAEWIKPLWEKGFFKNPPDYLRQGDSIQFPPWIESRYLARMASIEPRLVAEIILKIPENGNIRVYEDLADAVLRIPSEIGVGLLEKAKKWLETSPDHLLLPTKLGDFVVHLSKGGQIDAAFDLAGALFEILPDPKEYNERDDAYSLPPSPRLRYNVWDYIENLKKCITKLLEASWARAFKFACDLLEKAIGYSRRKGEASAHQDASAIWRLAIEDHEQNHPYDLKDNLVNEVRDAAEMLCREDNSQISEIVKYLEERRWKVFQRIALHVIRVFADHAPDLAVERLTDWKLFNDEWTSHEYRLLLGERYGKLFPPKQEIILNWIAYGPDVDKFKKGVEKRLGQSPSDEEVSKYQKIWRRDKLSLIKDGLNQEQREEYEKLVDEFGPPDHPTFPFYIKMGWGFESPKSAQEIQQMTVPEVIQFLKDWRSPTKPPFEPSPIGLGRTFSVVVAQSPKQYAENADKFKEIDPTYVRHLLHGLRDATSDNRSFAWEPVLGLCRWVVNQPVEIPGRNVPAWMDIDRDWSETRSAIARLLDEGFEERDSTIPIELRETAWSLLACLTDDPEPTTEYEEKLGKSMDPLTLSINTNRGEAMHAVVKYALWVRRYLDKQPDAKEIIDRGFDGMSEVKSILERHLDVSVDPSLAIRSVYGRWFPWLALLDKEWSRKNAAAIFPTSAEQLKFFFAAWDTYLKGAAYDDFVDLLKEQYSYAIDMIGMEMAEKREGSSDERLAHHLMTLYWRGKLDLHESEGVLAKFWQNASPQLRGHALAFIGRSLKDVKGAIYPVFMSRLRDLWQERLELAKNAKNLDEHKPEMAAFAFWFITDRFDDKWLLEHLAEALKISRRLKIVTFVMEKLAKLFDKFPEKVIECIDGLVSGDADPWTLSVIVDKSKPMLAKALEIEYLTFKAMEIIDRILSSGILVSEYMELMKKKKEE